MGASFGVAKFPFVTTWIPINRHNILPSRAINLRPILVIRPGGRDVFNSTSSPIMKKIDAKLVRYVLLQMLIFTTIYCHRRQRKLFEIFLPWFTRPKVTLEIIHISNIKYRISTNRIGTRNIPNMIVWPHCNGEIVRR